MPRISLVCHSGLDPESSIFSQFWIPAFAGMTALETFYETIKETENITTVRPWPCFGKTGDLSDHLAFLLDFNRQGIYSICFISLL